MDALAGHYDYEARKQGIQIEWKLELPKLLPLPEADLCTILGNLLENALHASQKLPPEERQIKVLARMLSPAMMGLMVENRYDGVLKSRAAFCTPPSMTDRASALFPSKLPCTGITAI